jgi:hypothetical protein
MANAFLTTPEISQLAVALLRRSIVLPATVSIVPVGDYVGPSGGTVLVRIPRTRTARTQGTPGNDITYDTVTEDHVSVTLSHFYSGALIADEDLTLSIENFGQQVLLPSVAAIAEQAENVLASAMITMTPAASGDDGSLIQWGASHNPDDDLATVLAIREKLTTNKNPSMGRYLACAPDVVTRLLSVPTFVQAMNRGDGGDALTSAVVGEVFGLTVVETNAFPAGTSIGYHSSGYAFANVAPAAVAAGAQSAVATDSGLELRSVLAFDAGKLSLASVVSVFAGASAVTDQSVMKRAIQVGTAA